MDPTLLGDLVRDTTLSTFAPERRDAEMSYVGLACPCGIDHFHLSGWPRVVTGNGGFFWRTLSRVWREARLPMQGGEPVESPFWLPIFARCDGCFSEVRLLDSALGAGQMDAARRGEPRESYRCRVCRRGSQELVVGIVADSRCASRADFEVVVRCRTCERQVRVAWSEGGRPSEQEVRLDLLYGRR